MSREEALLEEATRATDGSMAAIEEYLQHHIDHEARIVLHASPRFRMELAHSCLMEETANCLKACLEHLELPIPGGSKLQLALALVDYFIDDFFLPWSTPDAQILMLEEPATTADQPWAGFFIEPPRLNELVADHQFAWGEKMIPGKCTQKDRR